MFGGLSPIAVASQHAGFQSDGETTGATASSGYSDDFESVTDAGLLSSPGRGGALSVASSVPSYQRSPTRGRSLSSTGRYSADFEDYNSAGDSTGGFHGGCELPLPSSLLLPPSPQNFGSVVAAKLLYLSGVDLAPAGSD